MPRLSGLLFALSLTVAVVACRAEDGAPAGPTKAALTARGPVGLYFMTRLFNGNLEKSAWYFSPDGQAYENLSTGFTAADLAAHKGRKGTFRLEGKDLTATWADGTTTKSELERDNDGVSFSWDLGGFTPTQPIRDAKSIVGKYEGGASASGGTSTVRTAQSLQLNDDGTFVWDGIGTILFADDSSGKSKEELGAASSGGQSGTWKSEPYSLVLTSGGKTTRRIAFPVDVSGDPTKPDYLYVSGMMFKKQ